MVIEEKIMSGFYFWGRLSFIRHDTLLIYVIRRNIKQFTPHFYFKKKTSKILKAAYWMNKVSTVVVSLVKRKPQKPKFDWRIHGQCVHVWASEFPVSEHPDTEYSLAWVCPIFTLLKWDRRTERWQRTREWRSAALSELSPAPLAKRPWPQPYPLQGRRGDIRAEADMVIGGERETKNETKAWKWKTDW